MMERPERLEVFMSMALIISKLSRDDQTQHGCVITDNLHRIIGVGYNSFARGLNDSDLKEKGYTVRPKKYPWMIHAEVNAIANCHNTENGVAYITGQSCFGCLQNLWQAGIEEIWCLDRKAVMINEEEEKLCTEFIKQTKFKHPTGMRVNVVRPNLNFLLQSVAELNRLGFITNEIDEMEKATS